MCLPKDISQSRIIFAFTLFILYSSIKCEFNPSKVIYAVNCGDHVKVTDLLGIEYIPDTTFKKKGTVHISDRAINRVNLHDSRLYQSERYHNNDFSYEIPINKDGNYVLVLKFSEVYFKNTGQKIFDVELSGEPVVRDLDIFKNSGFCMAHDEYVPFDIKHNKLVLNGRHIDIDTSLKLTFRKTIADNPKINAFYVYQGPLVDIPKLEPINSIYEREEIEDLEDMDKEVVSSNEDEDSEDELDISNFAQNKFEQLQTEMVEQEKQRQMDLLKRSGYIASPSSSNDIGDTESMQQHYPTIHPTKNPYDEDSPSLVLPLILCVVAFVPILIYACRI